MKRIDIINSGLTLLTASAVLLCAIAPAGAQDKKPNILIL
jgi:hypothetical protein